jgi:hypothetical protein
MPITRRGAYRIQPNQLKYLLCSPIIDDRFRPEHRDFPYKTVNDRPTLPEIGESANLNVLTLFQMLPPGLGGCVARLGERRRQHQSSR